jgi:hypothetical protein
VAVKHGRGAFANRGALEHPWFADDGAKIVFEVRLHAA